VSDYPEHDKLRAVKNDTQLIHAFLMWLEHGERKEPYEKSIQLAEYDDNSRLQLSSVPHDQLIAMYAGIDLKKLEKEKLAMLDKQREMNREHQAELKRKATAKSQPTGDSTCTAS